MEYISMNSFRIIRVLPNIGSFLVEHRRLLI